MEPRFINDSTFLKTLELRETLFLRATRTALSRTSHLSPAPVPSGEEPIAEIAIGVPSRSVERSYVRQVSAIEREK